MHHPVIYRNVKPLHRTAAYPFIPYVLTQDDKTDNYYDRSLESVVFALTDHEYTKANKQKYSNADLYSYRTERV